MKFGRTPREFLASVDSRDLNELFAFFALQDEELKEQETQTMESSWRSILSKPK